MQKETEYKSKLNGAAHKPRKRKVKSEVESGGAGASGEKKGKVPAGGSTPGAGPVKAGKKMVKTEQIGLSKTAGAVKTTRLRAQKKADTAPRNEEHPAIEPSPEPLPVKSEQLL